MVNKDLITQFNSIQWDVMRLQTTYEYEHQSHYSFIKLEA